MTDATTLPKPGAAPVKLAPATAGPGTSAPTTPGALKPGESHTASLQRRRAFGLNTMAKVIRRRDEIYNTWCTTAEAEHSLADVLTPYYLWRRAEDFKPNDRFEIRHELGHFLVEGIILQVDKPTQSITFQVLNVYDLTQKPVTTGDLSGAVIMKAGDGWVVQRGAVRLSPALANEADAQAWLVQTQKRIEAIKVKGGEALQR